MKKAKYYALSSMGEKLVYTREGREKMIRDWTIVSGDFASAEEAEEKGLEEIEKSFPRKDSTERSTLLRNLVVVSKSKLRQYGISLERC